MRTPRKNIITIEGNIGYLKTISKKYGDVVFIVDKDDIPRIRNHYWTPYCNDGNFYAGTSIGREITGDCFTIFLHRYVTSFEFPVVDHSNRNSLDNRKSNLRPCTHSQNSGNRKTFYSHKGYIKIKDKYYASIHFNGRRRGLGAFNTPEEATQAYREAHLNLHGDFSPMASL